MLANLLTNAITQHMAGNENRLCRKFGMRMSIKMSKRTGTRMSIKMSTRTGTRMSIKMCTRTGTRMSIMTSTRMAKRTSTRTLIGPSASVGSKSLTPDLNNRASLAGRHCLALPGTTG